ncbi:hypothetical protein CK203_050712 [Vitis vinifera]|uniref:Uncharacterized protein n=1 Tax=Vitis vinifera TaxID=29760 RepID=A0A438H8T5_VITVI|nr:hypothetical protein CK203_050712 [Vitis vinifera]
MAPSLHVDASEGLQSLCSHNLDFDTPSLVSNHHFFYAFPGPYPHSFLHALQDWIFVLSLDLPSWISVEGRLVRFSERSGIDQQVVIVDQFTAAMASIQEALASLRQEIGSQQSRPLIVQDETLHDSLPPPPPLPIPIGPQGSPYVLHGHSEIAPPTVVQTTVIDDAHARMDRIEQRMRQCIEKGARGFEQRTDESVSSFISRWCEKIAEIIDKPIGERSDTDGSKESTAKDYQTCLWIDSSPSNVKGKKPFGRQRSVDGTERPPVSYTATGTTMLYGTVRRETYIFPSQAQSSAGLYSLCFEDVETVFTVKYAIEPGSSEAYRSRLLTALTPRHVIQDLIDQGLVHLGQPSVTTNPLLAHTTHTVFSPADSMHSIDFVKFDDHIHMLSCDDSELEPIVSDEIYEMSGMTLDLGCFAQTPFVLILNVDEVQTPYVDDVHTSDVQYVICGGRVVRKQPPTTLRPLEGTSSQEEVRRDDDKILRQLQSPQGLHFHMELVGHLLVLTETH